MNKHVKNIILFFILSLTSILIIMFFRMGFFKEVQIEKVSGENFHLLYKTHLGPYHEVLKDIEFVEKWAKQKNISCKKTFGQYLDNPDLTPPERLRAHVGCVLDSKIQVDELDLKKEQLNYLNYTNPEFVKAQFEGSPAIGPLKVYPAVMSWAQSKNLEFKEGVLEIYKPIDDYMRTYFYFPVK